MPEHIFVKNADSTFLDLNFTVIGVMILLKEPMPNFSV